MFQAHFDFIFALLAADRLERIKIVSELINEQLLTQSPDPSASLDVDQVSWN